VAAKSVESSAKNSIGVGDGGDNELKRFVRYAAVVTNTLPPERDNSKVWNSPQLIYSGLVGFNRFLLEDFKGGQTEDQIRKSSVIVQAHFLSEMDSERIWEGSDSQLRFTIGKLNTFGYLSVDGRNLKVQPKLIDLLVGHAKTVLRFMTGVELAGSDASLRAWLELNEAIFNGFFLANFGNQWRVFRKKVGANLRAVPGKSRRSKLNENRSYWVILNILLVAGRAKPNQFQGYVNELELNSLAPKMGPIEDAAAELCKRGVLMECAGGFTFASGYEPEAEGLRAVIRREFPTIRRICEEWAHAQQESKRTRQRRQVSAKRR
jgi:hypothetical protein